MVIRIRRALKTVITAVVAVMTVTTINATKAGTGVHQNIHERT